MDENKDILNNEGEAPVDDVAEEAAEAIEDAEKAVSEPTEEVSGETVSESAEEAEEEAVSEPVEEALDETVSESDEETGEEAVPEEDAAEPEAVEVPKKKKAFVPFIIIAVGIVVLASAFFIGYKMTYNPYNHMGYINVSGKTVGDIAEEYGMTLEEFLAEYDLPADMRADTEEAAASYMIPISNIIANYGIDFETFAEYYGFDESVTADTPWGEALDSMTLSNMVGEENLEEFIEEYELGDKVTGETKWGEVRRKVDKISYAKQQEAATAEDVVSDEYVEDVTE